MSRATPAIVILGQGSLATARRIQQVYPAAQIHGLAGRVEGADSRYEEFGCEDARITLIDDVWYINYSAVSSLGISTALATTVDFISVDKKGLIFCPDNRDVCFFPEKVGGSFRALTRPAPCHFGHPEIWICESPDMLHWGNHRHLLGRSGDEWDALKSGGGAPLIKTARGWLEIYHGVDASQRYCLGALLLDLEDPLTLIAKSSVPLLEPSAPYEREGFSVTSSLPAGRWCVMTRCISGMVRRMSVSPWPRCRWTSCGNIWAWSKP